MHGIFLQPMKWMGYILAFYVIMLATVPCCAVDNCPEEKTGKTTNHQPGDEDCGNCSPFFNCEGCATATIAFEPLAIGIAPIKEVVVYTNYLQTSLPTVNYDFWQPPQLG